MPSLRDRDERAARQAERLARRTARRHLRQEFRPPRRRRGRVILWAPEARERIVVRHAELPRVLTERAGGWRTVPRQGRRPLTVWDGYEPLRVQLVLFLDGWQEMPARSVAPQIRSIREMARRVPELDRPPWVRAIGVVPYSRTRWVIEALQVVEDRHVRGRVVRARVTVTLLEWVDPEVDLRVERPRRPTRQRTHDWQRGDTLPKLAKRYLGDARRARDIAAANDRIRVWSRVRPGTAIRIPHRSARQ